MRGVGWGRRAGEEGKEWQSFQWEVAATRESRVLPIVWLLFTSKLLSMPPMERERR